MSGTTHGRIDCHSDAGNNWRNVQEAYKGLFDFMSGLASWTRKSYFVGDTGGNVPAGSGRGTDFWDGTNPMGRNAWAMFEATSATNKFYVLIQYQDGSSETVGGGGNLNGVSSIGTRTAIGIQMAAAVTSGGADANPFQGTMNNDGADTKTSSWWAAPGGGKLYVFPRNNSAGGGYATNHNNLADAWSHGTSTNNNGPLRYHFAADNDHLSMAFDFGTLGAWGVTTAGVYVPRADLTVNRPLVMLSESSGTSDGFQRHTSVQYGPTGAVTTAQNGGIRGTDSLVGASSATDVHSVSLDTLITFPLSTTFQPNMAFATPAFDEWPLFLAAAESAAAFGYLGTYDFVRHVYNVDNHDTKSNRTRAYFGNTTTAVTKFSLPWDGTTAPGTTLTRTGVTF